jgi:hypothetical protein
LYKECFLQMCQAGNSVQSYASFCRNDFYHLIVTVYNSVNIGLGYRDKSAKDQYLQ